MTARPFVGIDLDGVVVDSNDLMAQVLSREGGLPMDWRDWHRYDVYAFANVTLDRFLDLLIEHEVLERAPPTPGAAEAIRRLRSEGLSVGIVTARAFHPHGERVTENWLARWDIDVDALELVGQGESKYGHLKSLHGQDGLLCYVDDHLGHLEDLKRQGLEVPLFVMDQPWNAADRRFSRVQNMPEYADQALSLHRSHEPSIPVTRFRQRKIP